MRTIKKRPSPPALTQWRSPRLANNRGEGMECTYEEMRRDRPALEAVEEGLFKEQGGLCAYTGRQLRFETGDRRYVGFHIEHLIPQDHCTYGQDADYANIVACWPPPNCGYEPPYGAKKKGNWPSPEEMNLFLSPLDKSCTARFSFNHHGEILPTNPNDDAAKETIEKLGLAHHELTALRYNAIQGALNPPGRKLELNEAKKLLRQIEADTAKLDSGQSVKLRAYSFVIQQALPREIHKLEGIRQQKVKGHRSAAKTSTKPSRKP